MADTLRLLADVYMTWGKPAEAEPLLLQALAIEEKAHGPDNLSDDGIWSLRMLAEWYHQQDRYAEAEQFYRWELAIAEKHQGPDSWSVTGPLALLARRKRDQGMYAESEVLFLRTLAIFERIRHDTNSIVASELVAVLKDHAALLRKMNRELEAKKLEARAAAIRAERPLVR